MPLELKPASPDWKERTIDSFNRQKVMHLIGARMIAVEPGMTQIELPFRDDLTQQHGFFHAGITTTIADSAGGYAAFSLFPDSASVLTVEFKVNLLAPADGQRLLATGRVVRPGKTLTICQLEVEAIKDGKPKLCAYGVSTLMCMDGMADRR